MAPGILFITLLLCGGIAASQVWLGWAKGKIFGRSGLVDRATNPANFWLMLAVWGVLALALPVLGVLFGIASWVRWNG